MKKVPIEIEAKIVRLFHAEGWPPNTIARQLGVHYCVVRRVLSEQGVPAPKLAPRPSKVDPYVPFIRETLEKYPRLRATRLWHMAKARGFDGGISRFREIVAMHRPRKQPEAFLRLTMLPADQAQVDWAHFGHVTVGKAKRKLMAFVMTLSYSRHTFLRFFHESHMPVFLQGHVEAFEFFEGVPRRLLYDNLKSAVTSRAGDAVQWNETLLACAKHYRFGPRVAAPYRGNEKGRVERRIRYIRESFFAARPWRDLVRLNAEAKQWCMDVAAKRPWPDGTEETVEQAFELEKTGLMALPDDRFPAYDRVDVRVGKTLAAVMEEINDRDTVHVPCVRQLLEQRRRAQNRPPPTKVELPSPQLQELVVVPHDLREYDKLASAHDETEVGDDDPS